MAITIGSNIASLRAQRRLNEGSNTLSRVYERLSSGQRINHASDDAAGLAVSSTLNAQARIYTQALRNVDDGLSITSIAEGALSELTNIVQRQTELAEQSANGVYSDHQRAALNIEAQALSSEYNRIVETTKFNGLRLFGATRQQLTIQAGIGTSEALQLNLPAVAAASLIGDGTFAAGVSFASAAAGPSQIESADMNADGFNDLILRDFSSNSVSVLLNNGNGSFKSGVLLGTDVNPRDMALADLNGDGLVDIVTADSGGVQRRASIFLNNGNGTFKSSSALTSSTGQEDVTLADVNGDGRADILLAERVSQTISIFLNNGNGTFKADVTYAAGNDDWEVKVADLNNDGALDLVTSNLAGGTLGIFIGNGNGTFNSGLIYGGLNAAQDPKFADFNHDGFTDIVADTFGGGIRVLLNNGNATFKWTGYGGGNNPTDNVVGDLNGDGYDDIITSNSTGANVSVFINKGDGTFKASITYSLGSAGGQLAAGDFNGDGRLDFATESGSSAVVFLNNGNGSFSPAGTYATNAGPLDIVAADLSGDGVIDLATADSTANAVSVFVSGAQYPSDVPGVPIDISTQSSAQNALTLLSLTRNNLSDARSTIGTMQSRLTVARSVLATRKENYLAADARIRDADIASDAATLIATQIRQQVASAILAQANQEPALALTLLRR